MIGIATVAVRQLSRSEHRQRQPTPKHADSGLVRPCRMQFQLKLAPSHVAASLTSSSFSSSSFSSSVSSALSVSESRFADALTEVSPLLLARRLFGRCLRRLALNQIMGKQGEA